MAFDHGLIMKSKRKKCLWSLMRVFYKEELKSGNKNEFKMQKI